MQKMKKYLSIACITLMVLACGRDTSSVDKMIRGTWKLKQGNQDVRFVIMANQTILIQPKQEPLKTNYTILSRKESDQCLDIKTVPVEEPEYVLIRTLCVSSDFKIMDEFIDLSNVHNEWEFVK